MAKITMYLSRIGYLIALISFLILSRGSYGNLAPCHSYLEEEEGFITSPDSAQRLYSDLECIFDIARSSLDQCVEEFKLEGQDIDGFCKKDWLSIDSCVPEGGSRFCGDLAPVSYEYPFQQGAEAFRLIFCSGNYTREKKFRIRYKLLTECNNGLNLYWDPPVSFIPGVKPKETPCFTQVTEKKGTINTPYFPRYYPNDMDCIYEFVRESPYICGIRMKTISFELDNAIVDENACLDFFHMPGCGFLCGSLRYIWTAKFQPGATSLKFHFHSDENETRQGFQIAFEQIYNC